MNDCCCDKDDKAGSIKSAATFTLSGSLIDEIYDPCHQSFTWSIEYSIAWKGTAAGLQPFSFFQEGVCGLRFTNKCASFSPLVINNAKTMFLSKKHHATVSMHDKTGRHISFIDKQFLASIACSIVSVRVWFYQKTKNRNHGVVRVWGTKIHWLVQYGFCM